MWYLMPGGEVGVLNVVQAITPLSAVSELSDRTQRRTEFQRKRVAFLRLVGNVVDRSELKSRERRMNDRTRSTISARYATTGRSSRFVLI